MDSDQFEWDASKGESNLEKHGVSFEAARRRATKHEQREYYRSQTAE